MVDVSDLVVNVAPNIDVLAANTLTMKLSNLGGGGHIVVVNGDPYAPAIGPPTSAQCLIDDTLDAGTVSVFGITITAPNEDEVVTEGPVDVDASIAHGRMISSAKIQGLDTDVSSQTCGTLSFDAFGQTWSVDSCTVDVTKQLQQANLSEALQLGTIDKGKNKVTVGAQDDLANTTYAQRMFTSGVGSTVAPLVSSLSPRQRMQVESQLKQELGKAFINSPPELQPQSIEVNEDGGSIDLAFSFGVSTDGLNNFFQSSCDVVIADVKSKVQEALNQLSFPSFVLELPLACDPRIYTDPNILTLDGPLSCNVIPETDIMTVKVILPDILFNLRVHGYCKDTFLGVCVSEVDIDLGAGLNLLDFGFQFTLDEDLVLNGGSTRRSR